MGFGFARCGCIFFFFFGGGFCSQSCSSVVVVSAMGCDRGLCSQWLLGMSYGLVSSSMVMVWVTNVVLVLGVGFDGAVKFTLMVRFVYLVSCGGCCRSCL